MTANLNNLCAKIMIKRDTPSDPAPITKAEAKAALDIKQQIANLREYAHLTNQSPDFILDQLDKIRYGSYETLSPFTLVAIETTSERISAEIHPESVELLTVLLRAASNAPTKPLLPRLVNSVFAMVKSVPRKNGDDPSVAVSLTKLAVALRRKFPTTGPEEDDGEDDE
jgi:hypothetical protein